MNSYPCPMASSKLFVRPRGARGTASILAAFCAAAIGATSPALAQCTTQWNHPNGTFGVNGPVSASTLWDPDGSGPLGPRLVVAGSFSLGSGTGIAAYDLATNAWSPLGSVASVASLQAGPNGSLYLAAGSDVQSWNGFAWQTLGASMNGAVHAITLLANGDVLACGAFTAAGGTAANGYARWNGSAWQNAGPGVPAVGRTMTTLANGSVIASGSFTVSGTPNEYVARWNGLLWTMLGTSLNGVVRSVAGMPNGDVVIAGDFTAIGATTANRVARWNGSSWSALGIGMDAPVHAISALPNGDCVAGGAFTTAGGNTASRIARWDGAVWTNYRDGMEATVRSLTVLPGGRIAAAGDFRFADHVNVDRIARWDGAYWQTVGSGQPGVSGIRAIAFLPNGQMVVGGTFDYGTDGIRRIARWDGSSWQAYGAGMSDGAGGGSVSALVVLANGDVVAGGRFSHAGSTMAANVARWDGTAWQAMGSGLPGEVTSLAVLANGDLVAGGTFSSPGYIARWDGSAWQPMGSGLNGSVYALLVQPNGDLAAAGSFTQAGGTYSPYVAKWVGGSWQALPGGFSSQVNSLAVDENGDLLAADSAWQYGAWGWNSYVNLKRLIAGVWQPVSSGQLVGWPYAVAGLPNGDIAVGSSYSPQFFGYLQRLSGSGSWSSFGSLGAEVYTIHVAGISDMYVGGNFSGPIHYRTTCPATLTTTGPGCPGSAGIPETTLSRVPWLGLTSQSRTTNLGSSSLAYVVWGFSNPNSALLSLHPLGIPGCNLYASLDITMLMIPFAGEITTSITIPNSMAFAGITLYHQVVQVDVDPILNPTAITSGNGLRLITGVF